MTGKLVGVFQLRVDDEQLKVPGRQVWENANDAKNVNLHKGMKKGGKRIGEKSETCIHSRSFALFASFAFLHPARSNR